MSAYKILKEETATNPWLRPYKAKNLWSFYSIMNTTDSDNVLPTNMQTIMETIMALIIV